MKKIIKSLSVFLSFSFIFACFSCSSLKITEEMQQAMDKYSEAVALSETKTSGKVTFSSVIDDKALEFKTTKTTVSYEYEVVEGNVSFTRVDTVDGVENVKYISDGVSVQKYDYKSGEWSDATEENKDYLSASKNPFVTLSLFRVDSKQKIRTDYLTDIVMTQTDGVTAVSFKLKDSTVSDVLGFYKADGIVRKSAGHDRTYYINSDGYIEKIVISTVQDIISNGEVGKYTTEMTVICE